MIDLGEVVDTEIFSRCFEILDDLESVSHIYGKKFILPEYTCWMSYSNRKKIGGYIGFTRNTRLHPILRESIDILSKTLEGIFPAEIPIDSNKFHFIKTCGNVSAHRDEFGRNCVLNIGLKNSSRAITRCSNNDSYDDLLTGNYSDHIVQEGHGYLLNTSVVHAVLGPDDVNRYLMTYGFFNVSYEDILDRFIKI